jgi:hypothetical protein
VALKVRERHASVAPEDGERLTVTTGGAVTVTVAVSLFDGSALLVATTWQVRAVAGAVYTPACVTEPQPEVSRTDQVTAVSEVPVTVAPKVSDPPVETEAVRGAMVTATTGAGVTVTTAIPWLAVSAALLARTWNVPVDGGAV